MGEQHIALHLDFLLAARVARQRKWKEPADASASVYAAVKGLPADRFVVSADTCKQHTCTRSRQHAGHTCLRPRATLWYRPIVLAHNLACGVITIDAQPLCAHTEEVENVGKFASCATIVA